MMHANLSTATSTTDEQVIEGTPSMPIREHIHWSWDPLACL